MNDEEMMLNNNLQMFLYGGGGGGGLFRWRTLIMMVSLISKRHLSGCFWELVRGSVNDFQGKSIEWSY